MAGFIVFADAPEKRRSDGMNTVLVTAPDAAGARQTARDLVGDTSGFESFAAIQISAADLATPNVVIEGGSPVGAVGNLTWPTLRRSGDTLRGS